MKRKITQNDIFEVEMEILRKGMYDKKQNPVEYYAWEICNEGRRRACREGIEEFPTAKAFLEYVLGGSKDWIAYSMEGKSCDYRLDIQVRLGYDYEDNIDSTRLRLEQGKALKKAARLVSKMLNEKR